VIKALSAPPGGVGVNSISRLSPITWGTISASRIGRRSPRRTSRCSPTPLVRTSGFMSAVLCAAAGSGVGCEEYEWACAAQGGPQLGCAHVNHAVLCGVLEVEQAP
jgi:hypothetical protein